MLIRLGSDKSPVSHDERRDAGDAQFSRPLPIGIDRFLKLSLRKHLFRLRSRQSKPLGNRNQIVNFREVHTVGEVGVEQCIVDLLTIGLSLGPLGQFLCQPAVVGHRSLAVWQTFLGHQLRHPCLGSRNVDVAAGEQFFQRKPRFGCLGMQRKRSVDDVDVERRLQFFHTPGAEITPRSDVVGENFERNHGRVSQSYFVDKLIANFADVWMASFQLSACDRPEILHGLKL